jgi:ferredoxin
MTPGPLEVRVDRERCMGSGNCAFRAPATFDLDDHDVAIVVGDPAVDEHAVHLAVEECPTNALSIAYRATS